MNEFTQEIQSTVIEAADPVVAPRADLTYNTPPEAKPDAKPEVKEEPKLSRKEQIEASLKKIEEDDKAAKAAIKEKPEPEPKPDAAKPAKAADLDQEPVKDGDARKPHQQEGQADPSSEDDKRAPPARLSDDAKQVWRSTPRSVKAEFHRIESEFQRIASETEEARTFHAELKPYADMAKGVNTTVKAALDRYVDFDKQIYADFGKGVAAIAKDQGKTPQEAITGVLRAYGVTPQQFAQAVTQNPQAFAPQPQAQRDPAIQQIAEQQRQIMARLQQQEQQHHLSELQSEVSRWASGKSDYQGLEPAIAEILKSGIIERIHGNGLSVVQRLDAAYRMAGGNAGAVVPQSQNHAAAQGDAPPPVAGAVPSRPDAGNLSITGAPNGGKDAAIPRKPKSRRESIEAALAKLQAQ